jgi:hypothetical protein
MVSTFTTARNLEKPAAGDQVGTWGTASINPDLDVIDAGMGQRVTIDGSAGSVVLAAAQFRCAQITINSTLLASITLTFPTSFTGGYTMYHAATGSSAFTITLATTAAGGEAICCKPGELFDIFNNGTNIRFRNLGHIGSYWDYAGSSVPNWVSGCTVPPYLNCDGTVFSSATYPQLTAITGTTLPDLRGRMRAYLNQGTGRLTSSQGGVDGNTNYASGGSQTTTLSSVNIPNYALPVTDPGHFHPNQANGTLARGGSDTCPDSTLGGTTFNSCSATTGISVNSGGSGTPFSNVPPAVVGGITMIRAA